MSEYLMVPEEVVTDPKRRPGDCFAAAAKLVLADASFTLVHGMVTAPADADGLDGRAKPGERHVHAWAEKRAPVRLPDGRVRTTTVCLDLSSGRQVAAPAEMYYRLGKIGRTFRYSQIETRVMLTEHDHWGPWKELP